MSNADRIRGLTDKELAERLSNLGYLCPPGDRAVNCPGEDYCKTCWLGWLREED